MCLRQIENAREFQVSRNSMNFFPFLVNSKVHEHLQPFFIQIYRKFVSVAPDVYPDAIVKHEQAVIAVKTPLNHVHVERDFFPS